VGREHRACVIVDGLMKTHLSLILIASLVPIAAAADKATELAQRQRQRAGDAVSVTPDPKAPRPPEQIKKTQINELKDNPAKKEIRALEDQIYTMEKPGSTVWQFLDDPTGAGYRTIGYVSTQIEKLEAALAAVRAANASWAKLPDYDRRVTYLKRAAAAHAAHYAAVDAAKQGAADQAEADAAAAWAAKRVKDEGPRHDLHKRSAGKILFAAAAIDPGDGAPPVLGAAPVDAPLFARGYFAESAWNTLHTAGVDCGSAPATLESYLLYTRYQVNGEATFEFGAMKLDKPTFQTTTSTPLSKHGSFTVGGAFATRDDEGMGTFRWITSVAPKLRVGDNKVKLELHAWCYGAPHGGALIASGEITITATKDSLEALAKRASFKMAPSVHSKQQMAGVLAKVTRHYEGRGQDVLDFRTASEWQPVRHELSGAILHRAANAVAVLRKRGTIECTAASLVLEEPYDGTRYGPALNFGFASERPFPCQPR